MGDKFTFSDNVFKHSGQVCEIVDIYRWPGLIEGLAPSFKVSFSPNVTEIYTDRELYLHITPRTLDKGDFYNFCLSIAVFLAAFAFYSYDMYCMSILFTLFGFANLYGLYESYRNIAVNDETNHSHAI